jgi:DNA-binding transcriptional ArsR family regulator
MADEDIRGLRAMAHPVRLRMVSLLTGSAMSAAEVARELGLTHANASYHLRILLDSGEIVEAGEERIRGGLAKKYRYPHERRGHHGRTTGPEDHVVYARTLGRELERRVRERKPRTKSMSSDLEGWVPPEVWQRALDLLTEASHLLHDHNQPPRTPGTLHISQSSWAFQMTTEGDES